ncbi:hypothetical protein CTEN210_12284 [Chaetoceros tenuissimus]|uniref:tRNA:m(4)X modification enzyme TRM13 n=1 Tax=Chaetoceros tenuissimus TaxID=426638 RepID=A0AAD3D105_9STRA|nr:hypothetical protein CTEN210_12284 [Chaetoceros tenuissimus]
MSHQPETDLGKRSRSKISNITGMQVQSLLHKLQIIQPFLPNIPFCEIISDQDYDKGEANVSNNEKNGKHVLQEVSIIGHLRRIQALKTCNRAIELGAGTARLSDRLQKVTECKLDHVLIDRQEFHDNHCRNRILKARICKCCKDTGKDRRKVERVTVDIGSLKMEQFLCEVDGDCNKIQALCMSKHLCGPACDLALSSLSRAVDKINCMPPTAIATCCHYLCDWDCFSGKDFWIALGLTEEDFIVATTVSQWASLQDKKKMKRDSSNKNDLQESITPLPNLFQVASQIKDALANVDEEEQANNFISSQEFERTFSREAKAQLGIRLKQLFDFSRASFCQQIGYEHVELVRYTTLSVENRLLIMYK